ncbi:MAG: Gmad2 immunoglobulin-like domain-containing protein [Patescibacteria group bacterium]|jgi:hypothetical protein
MFKKMLIATLGLALFGAGCADRSNLVRLTNFDESKPVSSPLVLRGEAVDSFFFEAQFPVKVLDENGTMIGSSTAHADGDWMTTDFVPFTATIEFVQPASGTHGTLLLEKDNPSGLPENAGALTVPITF